MNFPTLETCKLISAQFPDSEYIWILRGRSKDPSPAVIRRGEMVFGDELLANAPVCEESGFWLHSRGFSLVHEWLGVGKWILYRNNSHLAFTYCELSETQARAEAIELIMENKKWNPSTSPT